MKICLAGTYSYKRFVEKNPPRFVLESFWSIDEWQMPMIKKSEFFLLDSGAFSFMNSQRNGKQFTLKEIYDYLDRYIEFINKFDVKYFFELDLDVVIGYEEVKKMRKILEDKTGKKCIPVFHKNRGINEWYKMTEEYDFVAIGASGKNDSVWTRKHPEALIKLLQIAKKNNCKVHGLGYTNFSMLKQIPFYSVDSTSWASGWRYGSMHTFKNGKIVSYKKPPNKRMLKEMGWQAQEHNYKQWKKLQDYYDEV